jgi:hypothetical protein
MTNITAIDSKGNSKKFDVTISGTEMIDDKKLTKYEIREPREKPSLSEYFDLQIVKLSEDKQMVFMISNNDIASLSKKGIVKAMIMALSEELNCDIISSTNIESMKIDKREGRISTVTEFWKKWEKSMENVEFLEHENRFIYKRL